MRNQIKKEIGKFSLVGKKKFSNLAINSIFVTMEKIFNYFLSLFIYNFHVQLIECNLTVNRSFVN